MGVHVPLRQAQEHADAPGVRLEIREPEVRGFEHALHLRLAHEFKVPVHALQDFLERLGLARQQIREGTPQSGQFLPERLVPGNGLPQESVGRGCFLAGVAQYFSHLPVAPQSQLAHGGQVPPPLVFWRCQDMQDERLDHGPRRLIKKRPPPASPRAKLAPAWLTAPALALVPPPTAQNGGSKPPPPTTP